MWASNLWLNIGYFGICDGRVLQFHHHSTRLSRRKSHSPSIPVVISRYLPSRDHEMSEPIPESIPQSQVPRSHPQKKRSAPTPVTQQATLLASLFSKPDREIQLPPPTSGSASGKTSQSLPPPPEIVANVQGSSAGAGSGEFHVYKASRRREYERVKLMEEEVAREEADMGFVTKREELRKKDKERTEKRRKKREKVKGRKGTLGRKEGDAIGLDDSAGDAMDFGGEEARGSEEVKGIEEVGVVICDDD